jgi:hypothetical protein
MTRLYPEELFNHRLEPVSDEELERRIEAAVKREREAAAKRLREVILAIARRELL